MRNRVVFPLLVGISFALYANSLAGDYVFDDSSTFRSSAVRKQSLSELLKDYRPLRYLSYRIDEALLGDRPLAYHVFNVLYHGITSFVVFVLLRRLAGPGAALAAALLFAAHPVQTESVAYMSGRRDVLSTLLYLLALLAWTATTTSWLEIGLARRSRWLVPALALFVLAFFAKEMAVTLPAVCLLHDLLLKPPRARRRLRAIGRWPSLVAHGRRIAKPPLYGAAAALGIAAIVYVLRSGATHQDWHGGSMAANFATSAGLVLHYAVLLLFPLRLLGDHSYDAYPLSHSFLEPGVVLSLAAIALGAVVALRARRRAPLVTFGLGWFLVTLLPVLHIKPFHEIAADHYLYLPSVGFCLLAGLGFERLRARAGPRVAWAALGIVLAACSVRTVVRNRDWKDGETFWRATIASAPRCARAHFNLGTLYAQRWQAGKVPAQRDADIRAAEASMRRAVDIKPDYVVARTALGRVYRILGREGDAREQWEEALRLAKPMEWPPVDPGQLCIFLQRYDEAIEIYEARLASGVRRRVALDGLRICHKYLASRAMVDGRREEAVRHFRKALEAAELLLLEKPKDASLLREAADLAREVGDHRRAQELRARANRLAPPH